MGPHSRMAYNNIIQELQLVGCILGARGLILDWVPGGEGGTIESRTVRGVLGGY